MLVRTSLKGRHRAIGDFRWSRDGKRLAIVRKSVSRDIVLFRGLRR
jgi:hypothetical protein